MEFMLFSFKFIFSFKFDIFVQNVKIHLVEGFNLYFF